MKTINVGITSIGSGVGQSVIDSCRLSSLPIKTYGYGNNPYAFGAYACDEQKILPNIYAENYIDELITACRDDNIHVLIPGLDDELLLLADNIEKFKRVGVVIPISSRAVIELCRDKQKMSQVLNRYGANFVESYNKSDLGDEAKLANISYPLIAKPVSGFASRGLRVIKSESDLKNVTENDVVQEIAAPSAADPNHEAFMKALENDEIAQLGELSLQIVVGRNSHELGRFASYNKLHNGVPIEILPANVPEVWEAIDEFMPVLHDYGVYGPINIQGRMTDKGPRFFEMNARFTGITGLRAMTGFNEVEAIILDAVDQHSSHSLKQNSRKIGIRQVTNKTVSLDVWSHLSSAVNNSQSTRTNNSARNILVTGANSYLGRAVLKQLLVEEQFGDIFALVRRPERFDGEQEPKLPVGVKVISNDDLYQGRFNVGVVDIICHIASARPVHDQQTLADSLKFTQFLAHLSTTHQVPGFINISSQSVYGTGRPPLWDESDPVAPETAYAQTKWASELMVSNIHNLNPHCKTTSLRLGRVVGASEVMRLDELPHKFMKSALKGEKLSVWGGSQKLDFIDIRDAAEIISKIALSPYNLWKRELNVSSGRPISVMELAERCLLVAKKMGFAVANIDVQKAFEAPSFGMSIKRLTSAYAWQARHDLDSTLFSLVEAMKDEI